MGAIVAAGVAELAATVAGAGVDAAGLCEAEHASKRTNNGAQKA
jgi:hypothetical protein